MREVMAVNKRKVILKNRICNAAACGIIYLSKEYLRKEMRLMMIVLEKC